MRHHAALLLLCTVLVSPLAGCNRSSTSAGAPSVSTAPPGTPPAASAETAPTTADSLQTSQGPVTFTPLQHASFMVGFAGKTIYLDPVSNALSDGLPKADFVFLTDIHPDHLDSAAIDRIRTPATVLIGPQVVADKLPGTIVLNNGDRRPFGSFEAEATAAYNLQRGPEAGKLFHDKGRGNGYLFTFADKRVFVSGDTECTPEMRALRNIDVAFVCMNLPYTMPPSEAAECIRAFQPKVVYPFHFRGSDLKPLEAALGPGSGVEVRIRDWYRAGGGK